MSDGHAPHWGEFERRDAADPRQPTPAQMAFNDLCAHVFTTPHGRDLMTALRKATIELRTRSGAPEAELREIEAQRRFVAGLEAARDAGLEALRTKRKTS